ncbi:MAG: hypothetical protein AB1720_12980 [Pseudomonadota bacterium]
MRAYLSVFGGDRPTPDGTGVRDCIHVVDLARMCADAWRRQSDNPEGYARGAGGRGARLGRAS